MGHRHISNDLCNENRAGSSPATLSALWQARQDRHKADEPGDLARWDRLHSSPPARPPTRLESVCASSFS